MDRRALDDRRRIGTVKAAVNKYGERIREGSSSLKQPEIDFPEKSCSRAKELHIAKREMERYKDTRKAAESAKFQAQSELSSAKNTVKDLTTQIQESNAKAKARIRDIENLNDPGFDSNHQYAEITRELDIVKQELTKLKLDMDSVLEEKRQAEKELEASSSKLSSDLSSVEGLKKEIEDANEEQVLVELAEIEALKELGEIQTQREKEYDEFVLKKEKATTKMKDLLEEIEDSKELESKLFDTLADVEVLQNELKVVKEIEKKEDLISLTEELEQAKKELAVVKEEGFKFMASMDVIRNELMHVTQENEKLQKTEQKADLTVQSLKSKLLRAKTKLESATEAEEQAQALLSNLTLTLEQLKTQAETAKKEKELIAAETSKIKEEIEKTEVEIDSTEEKLEAAMQELEAVKESEDEALQKLQYLIENAMRNRASASQESSSITISKFEYEYLTGQASRAEEIADKKVAAAEAWVEALKASEKEIMMKIEMAHREMKETKMEEVNRTTGGFKRGVEREVKGENFERVGERKSMRSNGNSTPRKSMKTNGKSTPLKGGKSPRSTTFTIRKKKKVMPDLAKLFGCKVVSKNH